MKGLKSWTLPWLAIALFAAHAQADEESTITLMDDPDAELPEAVTETIVLPDEAAPEGVENSAEGLRIANEARERGADFGAEMADHAREGRESFGRGMAGGNVPGGELPNEVPELSQPPVAPPVP